MKRALCILGTCLALSTPSHADRILGVFVGGYAWNQDFSGDIEDLDTSGVLDSTVDLEDDLGFDDETGNVIYVALEHPVPLIPNIRLQQTELKIDSASADVNISFGDEDFTGEISSDLDLSHTDATLYWQLLDNYISLDIGITARLFEGELDIEETGTNTTANEEFDAVLPLLYSKARIDLPLSGLYAELSGNFLSIDEGSFLDYEAKIGYETPFRLGIEAGFRSMEFELDDVDDIDADITVDGAFFGLFFHL